MLEDKDELEDFVDLGTKEYGRLEGLAMHINFCAGRRDLDRGRGCVSHRNNQR